MNMSAVNTKAAAAQEADLLPFRPILLQDRARIEKYLHRMPTFLCEHCFVDLFIWKDHYHTEVCFWNDFLLIRCRSFPENIFMYLAPIGQGNLKAALEAIRRDAEGRRLPMILSSITPEQLPQYQELLGNDFVYTTSEDSSDYVYLRDKLSTLSGKKLQPKRNLVNRFQQAHAGVWEYIPITPENTEEAYAFHLTWCEKNGCWQDDAFKGESCAIRIALSNFEALDLRGGMIKLNGKVIAFTLGCLAREDLAIVQIEKADTDIAGAYQMINQQFVRHALDGVTYVNREEDLGLEGLRRAKRSYYPAFYGIRYSAIPATEAHYDPHGSSI